MGKEYIFLLMVRNMKVKLKMELNRVKENIGIRMEIYMKAIGLMIRSMGMVN